MTFPQPGGETSPITLKNRYDHYSIAERSGMLLKIAQAIEDHLEELAIVECWENGKPVRETMAADLPLAVDHFRYFAGVLRAEEGSITQIDDTTVAHHFKEPLGVVPRSSPATSRS